MPKRRFKRGNLKELTKSSRNITWEAGFHRVWRRFRRGFVGHGGMGLEVTGTWFSRCQKARESRDVKWRRYGGHKPQAVFERYKRGRDQYCRIRT